MLHTRRIATSLILVLVVVAGFIFVSATKAGQPPAGFANFEPAETNPIRLSADGTRLFAVNPANGSVSIFDTSQPQSPTLITEIPVGVGPVSVNPRTSDEIWVVNQESNSVSIVSVARGIVTDTIATGNGTEPVDVVFAGTNQAYVSCSRSNSIAVYDTGTHALIKSLPVFGGNPRALAVSNDGKKVYAAFAISGNATTIIPDAFAPPQPKPLNNKLPKPPKVGLIVAATDPHWTGYIKFKMPDNDVVEINVAKSPIVAGYYSAVGTINLGLAVNPITGDLFVSNTDALNLTFYEPSLRGHWINSRITRIEVADGRVTPFDLNPNVDYNILPNPQALATTLSQPASVVFDPSGNFMYVAAFGNDRVAQVDTNGNVLGFVEVALPSGQGSNADPKNKRGPRGLAFNSGAATLYALDSISNTISVIDTSTMSETGEVSVGTDPTPDTIKQGRGFLYDAKLSGNGTGSCASCHVDGDMDHLAWNLGDRSGDMVQINQNGQIIKFHPMKGPMTTQTLRGLLDVSPYHWRGEKTDFADFNPAFDTLMGGSQLSNPDMDIYNGFVNSILYFPNPNLGLDRSLPSSLDGGDPAKGENDFMTIHGTGGQFTCDACHTSNPGPGTNRLVIAGFRPQPMKTPHLRNMYQKQLYTRHNPQSIDGFGYSHDGQTASVYDFLEARNFEYTNQQKLDMSAYMLCFDTGTAPAVGFTMTFTSANIDNQQLEKNWSTLQTQAGLGNADLIARGTIQGQLHGLLYEARSGKYLSDTNAEYSQSQLQNFIRSGDTLTFMGVYPGTGTP